MPEIRLKTSVYPTEIIISSANCFLDKAYFSIDLDKDYVIVQITSKKEDILDAFKSELVRQLQLKKEFQESKDIKEKLLKDALSN